MNESQILPDNNSSQNVNAQSIISFSNFPFEKEDISIKNTLEIHNKMQIEDLREESKDLENSFKIFPQERLDERSYVETEEDKLFRENFLNFPSKYKEKPEEITTDPFSYNEDKKIVDLLMNSDVIETKKLDYKDNQNQIEFQNLKNLNIVEKNIENNNLTNIEDQKDETVNENYKIDENISERVDILDHSNKILIKNDNLNQYYNKKLRLEDFAKSSQNMISDYICELCNGVYWDPYVDGCGHVFCKECFYIFIELTQKSICPITKCDIDLNLVSPIKFVAAILEKQTLKCQHKNCNWSGKLIDLSNHLNIECLYEKVKCVYSQCTEKHERINIKSHEEICSFSPSECEKCLEKMLLGEKILHSKICKKEKIECPQSCKILVERDSIEDHILNDCGNSLMNCQYLEFGCLEKIKKMDLKNHLIEDVNFHNLCVCKFLNQFKTNLISRVEKIEKKLKDSNEKFDDIYSFLETDFRKIYEMLTNTQKVTTLDSNFNFSNYLNSKSGSQKNNDVNEMQACFEEHKDVKRNDDSMLGKKKFRTKENQDINMDSNENKTNKKNKEENKTNAYSDNFENFKNSTQEPFIFELPSEGLTHNQKNGSNVFTVETDKKKHKFILMKNAITKNQFFHYKVKIRKISGFMAFGICDKQRLSQNQYRFNGVSNVPHGCFLVSSNKYIWNNNLLIQNNCFMDNMPVFQKGDEIEFIYDPIQNLLKFKINNVFEGSIKKIITESQRYLVPCFILINKNDEISIDL